MVAPNQQNTVLMAGDGGVNSVSDVTLTFDDASTNRLPAATPILTSTNQPTANTKPTFH
jgi:peptidoglycan/xylan/chitin deacetylase (PgdA/CDA1 family)